MSTIILNSLKSSGKSLASKPEWFVESLGISQQTLNTLNTGGFLWELAETFDHHAFNLVETGLHREWKPGLNNIKAPTNLIRDFDKRVIQGKYFIQCWLNEDSENCRRTTCLPGKCIDTVKKKEGMRNVREKLINQISLL